MHDVIRGTCIQQPMAVVQTDTGRRNNFDFLRFLLASVVVFAHAFKLLGGDQMKLYFALTGFTNPAILAVDGFFVISGYLIARSWMHSKSVGDYLRKRMLRIFPGYLGVLLFCTLIVGPASTHDFSPYRQSGLGLLKAAAELRTPDVTGVFAGNPIPIVNEALWTLRYEFLCYVALAALGILGLLRKRTFVIVLFGLADLCHVVGTLLRDCLPQREVFLLGSAQEWARFATYFLAGSLCFLFRERLRFSRPRILAALGFLVFLVAPPWGAWASLLFSMTMPFLGAYLLLAAAFSSSARLQRFGRRGDLSYGIYLYHYPILQLLVQHTGAALNAYTLFLLAYPLTCGLALLSWRLLEKPALDRKATVTDRLPRLPATLPDSSDRPPP
jgi:peptidoglycan/LPS O-acetylase OafA/YrhL